MTTNPAIEQARRFFETRGLKLPYIPPELTERFAHISGGVFGTRRDLPGPYHIDAFIQEVCRKEVADYLILGHDGRGINSYAMHYYLVRGSLALFIQIGWGGVYTDEEASTLKVSTEFARAEELVEAVHAATQSNVLGPGERLVCVHSDLYGGQWARVRAPVEDLGSIVWNRDDQAMQSALAAIAE